ncbi:MAG TPA: radical SAM/CxCxxxxC motif protein YfkAB [Symbiobacteriaceae bacterium]|nr:radical SAM/CxCxxxxC motif protein YfkAB [Symbiobacteriaceae bacterium]
MGPHHDPWDPELSRRSGRHTLTSIEVTVTNRCNMRCRHCAVGETLTLREPDRIPLSLLFDRMDEVPTLQTFSITGGEPSADLATLTGCVLPLLQYARARGLLTQVNTNLTYDLERYRLITPYVDVLHISWNYASAADFHRIAWARGREQVAPATSSLLFGRIMENAMALAADGVFVSAESMVNSETAPHLGLLNRMIREMGCRRHEVHPMYPADWAANLPILDKEAFRTAINRFLDERDPALWVLFGTFPFLPCSADDRALLDRIRRAPRLSVRNCPDGRNRVNINAFTGDVFVTDFAEVPALGNITGEGLMTLFNRWQEHPAFAPYNCYCPEARCTGPNLLVAGMYHPGVDFRQRRAAL